jgi:hypothetical protein
MEWRGGCLPEEAIVQLSMDSTHGGSENEVPGEGAADDSQHCIEEGQTEVGDGDATRGSVSFLADVSSDGGMEERSIGGNEGGDSESGGLETGMAMFER